MKTPFTAEEFFNVFRTYNLAVYPLQILFYVLALFVVYLSFKASWISSVLISALLSFFWLWMGIAYHFIYFRAINPAAILFGSLFTLQGLLFIYYGMIKHSLSFKVRPNAYGYTGFLFVLFALIIYPISGAFLGHIYPASPTFGLPCPTTIFTFGILLWTQKKLPVPLLIIPFLWSLLGFFAAFSLGVKEDSALLVGGIVAVWMIVLQNRKKTLQLA